VNNTPRPTDRRRILIAAAALAVIGYAAMQGDWFARLLPKKSLPFKTLETPAGFRLLSGGATTGALDPFIGLGSKKPAGLVRAERQVTADICAALFARTPAPQGQVPIAYFFDYQCPICRRLTPRLRALEGVDITWHDLAALGPASETAARASIAARNQGAYDEFHNRLMRANFQPNESYVLSVAQSVGVNTEQLLRDMQSDAVSRQMWRSRAVANAFNMLGTPGMVVGRTVVIGDINDGDLAQLIALEAVEPGFCG